MGKREADGNEEEDSAELDDESADATGRGAGSEARCVVALVPLDDGMCASAVLLGGDTAAPTDGCAGEEEGEADEEEDEVTSAVLGADDSLTMALAARAHSVLLSGPV